MARRPRSSDNRCAASNQERNSCSETAPFSPSPGAKVQLLPSEGLRIRCASSGWIFGASLLPACRPLCRHTRWIFVKARNQIDKKLRICGKTPINRGESIFGIIAAQQSEQPRFQAKKFRIVRADFLDQIRKCLLNAIGCKGYRVRYEAKQCREDGSSDPRHKRKNLGMRWALREHLASDPARFFHRQIRRLISGDFEKIG